MLAAAALLEEAAVFAWPIAVGACAGVAVVVVSQRLVAREQRHLEGRAESRQCWIAAMYVSQKEADYNQSGHTGLTAQSRKYG